MAFIAEALQALAPDATFRIHDDDLEKLDLLTPNVPIPSVAEVEAKAQELAQAYNNQEYARQRAYEYYDWKTQLDMLYWDKKNGTNVWEQHIEAVKATYPKP